MLVRRPDDDEEELGLRVDFGLDLDLDLAAEEVDDGDTAQRDELEDLSPSEQQAEDVRGGRGKRGFTDPA